jgi:DNA/RNA-binding domain of Phe-tRNA-synthetase-like protein
MKIKIHNSVFTEYPKLRVALLLVKQIDNKTNLKESKSLLEDIGEYARLTFNKDTLENHSLLASWKLAQEGSGKKIKQRHSSLEKNLTRVLANKDISKKNVLDNVINYISLKNLVPITADDCADVKGDVHFKIVKGTERLKSLKQLPKGILFYRDSTKVLGSKFDFWKSPHARLTPETWSALIHLEAIAPMSNKRFNEVVKETVELVKTFTNGEVTKLVLNKKEPEGKL